MDLIIPCSLAWLFVFLPLPPNSGQILSEFVPHPSQSYYDFLSSLEVNQEMDSSLDPFIQTRWHQQDNKLEGRWLQVRYAVLPLFIFFIG